MAIVMIMDWPGVTREQYEQLRKEVNWEGDRPKGGNLHIAAFSETGLRATDIWDSAEENSAFVNERLMPVVMRMGITTEPRVEVFPLHAVYAPNVQEQ